MPLVEVQIIAVGDLRHLPAVEALGHQRHSHLVAETDELRGGHVVRGTDGIDTHVLHDADLAAHGGLIDCRTQWAKIVVQADALELDLTAVEEEAFARLELDGAHAEEHRIRVEELALVTDAHYIFIELRLTDVPKAGGLEVKARAEDRVHALGAEVARTLLTRYDPTLGGEELGLEVELARAERPEATEAGAYLHTCVVLAHLGRQDLRPPGGEVDGLGDGEVHIAVESSARVPAAALVLVF